MEDLTTEEIQPLGLESTLPTSVPVEDQPGQEPEETVTIETVSRVVPTDADQIALVWVLTGGHESVEQLTRINYDLEGLQKRRTLVKGELITTEYFLDHDLMSGQYTGLCVVETNHYLRQNDVVYCRLKNIEWMLSNGTVGASKTTKKTYELREGLAEGVTRRKNVYEDAKLTAIGLLGIAPATDLLSAFGAGLAIYFEGNKYTLLKTLKELQRPYLSEAHRQILLNILLIDDTLVQWGL